MVGPILDWGCGHGDDVVYLRNAYGYDPHHQPNLPTRGVKYNTVLCTYVLNTIPEYHDRCVILEEALEYLANRGWLYVSIRKVDNLMTDDTNHKEEEVSRQLLTGGFILLRSTGDMEIWGYRKVGSDG